MEKVTKYQGKKDKLKMLTNYPQVVLASSSQTRKKLLKKYFKCIIVKKHRVNENEIKKEKTRPENLVMKLAKLKAISIKSDFSHAMIIGSDQILVCEEKLINKPSNIKEAVENLLFLRNKEHVLMSAIYVIKEGKFFFKKMKKARLILRDLSKNQITSYVNQNRKTALSTVGSYKIEDNGKYGLIIVKSGDIETILGFPTKDFFNKLKNE